MNLADLLLVVLLFVGVSAGYRLGFVARVASWGGLALGVVVAVLVLPPLLRMLGASSSLSRLVITLLVFFFVTSIGGSLGGVIGRRVGGRIPVGPARSLDRVGGGLAGILGTLVLVWLLSPIAAEVPGVVARQVRNSAIISAVTTIAPTPPAPIRSLRRRVAQTPFPEVFTGLRPAPEMGVPPGQLPVSRQVLDRVTTATVAVESLACQRIQQGSGWVADQQTVVTNAHIVAGTERLQVRRPDGSVLDATVIAFDDNRDLAVLRVPGLDQAPLPLGDPQPGTEGVVVGYPGGQNQPRAVPAAVRRQVTAVGRDIYGNDRVRREVLLTAVNLSHGDSGAPLADTSGNVVGVIFAIAPDRPATAFAVTGSEVREVLSGARGAHPGPCL